MPALPIHYTWCETRVYLDRNVTVFDDLLSYIEYGVAFLKDVCKENGRKGLRFHRLVSDYVKVTAESTRNASDLVTNWRWNAFSGNKALLSRHRGSRGLPIAEVQTSGIYLIFFSLHSVAVTALFPNHGYYTEQVDEAS
ncbi:hypothetical protein ACHAXN_009894 [Cyclotella atomus]